MKVGEVYKISGIVQLYRHGAKHLTADNCQIIYAIRVGDSVVLNVKRLSDSTEGHAYILVEERFKSHSEDFIHWLLNNKQIHGKTLNELRGMEVHMNTSHIKKITPYMMR